MLDPPWIPQNPTMFLQTCPLRSPNPIISSLIWWVVHSRDGSSYICSFSSIDFQHCGAYGHTTLTTSSSKTMAREITLSYTLLTSPTLSCSSSFTSKLTTPCHSWFPGHHNSYLLPCKPISLAPHPLHLTSCKQNNSTFLFHSSSHISKRFPFNVSIFQVPSLIHTLFFYSMLPSLWWWGFSWSSTKLRNYNFTSELAGCPYWHQISHVYIDI